MFNAEALSSSFRDPSGFLFRADGVLYRQINQIYKDDYDYLMRSGLYEALANTGKIISHTEIPDAVPVTSKGYRIIRPNAIPFISYPYEWSFSQLKDAALLTLDIQEEALSRSMSLKDASAFNVQFLGSKPIFIDSLSFERYTEGAPWVAYQQFCRHFLAPLALMARKNIDLRLLSTSCLHGVPLSLASSLLPKRSWLNFSQLIHIHLHSRLQQKYAGLSKEIRQPGRLIKRSALLGLIGSLRSCVLGLTWRPGQTEWADYYEHTNYSADSLTAKERIIDDLIKLANPKTTWDLGANNGFFSRKSANGGAYTIAFDVDPSAVEKNYLQCKQEQQNSILPLILDLTNPSPSLGWGHNERSSLLDRGPADLVMGLALIHHLAISNNVPLENLARFFRSCGHSAIIEFVPKSDSQVQKLLVSRKDIFPEYTQGDFEREFGKFFTIERCVPVHDTQRILYLLKRNH